MTIKHILLQGTAMVVFATAASADMSAMAITDLNLRAGPGPNYGVIDVIDSEASVELEGCLAESNWCKVDFEGTEGWAYGEYLNVSTTEQVVVVTERPADVEIAQLTLDAEAVNAAGVGTMGAIAGAIIGGPAAIAAGLVLGAAIGDAATPDDEVIAFVADNPADPVFLQGEVVVGAKLPEQVVLYEVPDYQYRYVNVNGQTAFVDAESRSIVSINRN